MRLFLAALLAITSLSAGVDRTYLGLSITSEVADDWEVSLTPERRFDSENDIELYQTDLELTYKLKKNFEVGIGYRIGSVDTGDEWKDFDRWNVDLKYKTRWKQLTTQLRLRYVRGQDEDQNTKEFLRYRIKSSFDLKQLNLKPFLSYEYFDSLDKENSRDRHAYSGGVSYEPFKNHEFSIEYRWVDKLSSNNDYSVFLSSYSFKF